MKKYLFAIFGGLLLVLGLAMPAQAAIVGTGNRVCLTTSSGVNNWIQVSNGTTTVDMNYGRCSDTYYHVYNVRSFAVPYSSYCVSQWGYVYNGANLWPNLRYYYFSTAHNDLRLTCRPA